MRAIHKIRWRKRNNNAPPNELGLRRTWNPNLAKYIKGSSINLRKCVEEIYAKIFDGAKFPYEQEVYRKPEVIVEKPSHIGI